ncbi:MAG: hypothetical protein H7A32_03915 [Deltaproteobacteria bacterium]|nr:hypothetical protein [Deltaproteobacteria bacterium]
MQHIHAFETGANDTRSSEVLKSIQHIDHITFVDNYKNEQTFIERWKMLGFSELSRWHTDDFPAIHIALTSGQTPSFPWATMTGLSVSQDPHSSINEFIHRYGPGMQHVAYNIDPESDMEILQEELKKLGWNFMTPVLTYKDHVGSRLRQTFTAPTSPHGTFIELVQRIPGPDGSPYAGFDTQNIDDLYRAYYDYSIWLENKGAA